MRSSRLFAAMVGWVALISTAAADGSEPLGKGFLAPDRLPLLPLATSFGMWGGARWIDETQEPRNDSHFAYGGEAFGSIPFGRMLSVQLDLQGEGYNDDDGNFDQPLAAYMAGAHLSYRNPNQYLIGVFGGLGVPSVRESGAIDTGYLFGGEGQLYLGSVTLYGQGGWADFKSDDEPEGFVDGWFARGVARWFPGNWLLGNDSMFEVEYSYGETDCYIDSCDDSGRIHNWGAKWMTRLANAYPLYGTIGYQGGFYDATTELDDAREDTIRLGITLLGGVDSLKHNDRYGATLSTPMLPVRAAGWAEAID